MKRWYQPLLICFISLLVTVVYRFPDVYAYMTTPAGMVFLGQNSWFDPQDINIYASVIHYAQSGHFLLPNLWTAFPNQPIMIFPVEELLGYLFRSTQPYFLFWITSVVCGLGLIVGMYYLIRKQIPSHVLAAMTTVGIALGGGFGIFLYPNISSADITNGITFYETFFKPHEAISILFYLYGVIMFYEIFIHAIQRNLKTVLLISLALCVSFLIYPYLIALYFLTTIPFAIFSKTKIRIKEFVLVMILPILPVAFVAYQLSRNAGFYAPFMQHLATMPLSTFFGYGMLIPIFVFQLFFMKKTQFMKYINWWIISAFILALLPFGPGKIFLRGLFFPLVLLCVLQLQILLKKVSLVPTRMVCWGIFFVLLCLTSVYIMYLRISVLQTNEAVNVVYLPQEDYKIFIYLNDHTPRGSGVLAGGIMSNLIPAYTYDRGSIGSLWSLNQTYYSQLNSVDAFYAGQPVSKNYLKQNNVHYVLWGPNEQAITSRYARGEITDLRQLYKNLKLVYATDTSKLYQVK